MAQRKTILALLLLAGLMGSWSILDALDGQTLQGTWTMKSPLPAVRAEVAAVALDGKLHALGGVGGCGRRFRKLGITWQWREPTEQSMPSADLLLRSIRMPAQGVCVRSSR
jgi:hypothetical protein